MKKRVFIARVAALALAFLFLSSYVTVGTVVAGTGTTLTLDAPPSAAPEGSTVTFTGRLTRNDTGAGVEGVTVKIWDSDTWPDSDDPLASGTTDSNGYFSIAWTAEAADPWDSTTEPVAKFEGTASFNSSMSSVYTINITEKPGTTLTLSAPSTAVEGTTVTFTGRLTRNDTGAGVEGVTVKIWDSDTLPDTDDLLASGTTDSNGDYSITWTAEAADPWDSTTEPVAKFDGSTQLKSSMSSVYTINITEKPGTTLALDQPQSSVPEGENITFTGRLTRDDTGAGVPSATVKIWDDDIIGDDLMASDTTDSNGYFSITWTAVPMDVEDLSVEVKATYDGSTTLASSVSSYYSFTVSEKHSTTLILDTPSSSVYKGDSVTFTGRLTRDDTGKGIVNAEIKIYEADTWPNADDLMASDTTDSNGYFSISWTAKSMDLWSREIEVYAKYGGSTYWASSQSLTYTITVTGKRGTILTLDSPPATVLEGSNVIFTGRLTEVDTGEGIANVNIYLYDANDWPIPHDRLDFDTTDANGYFSITWTAKPMDWFDLDVEAYARFVGNARFKESESSVSRLFIEEKPTTVEDFDLSSLQKVVGGLDFGTGIEFSDFVFRFTQTSEGSKELYFKLESAEVAATWDSGGQLTYWSIDGEAEVTIKSGKHDIWIFAGPVPVIIHVEYRILVGIEVDGSSQVGQTGNIELKPYFKGIVQAYLYSIFGPEGTIKPYLRVQYHMENNSWLVFAGVEAELELNLDIFGYFSYTLWDASASYEFQVYPRE